LNGGGLGWGQPKITKGGEGRTTPFMFAQHAAQWGTSAFSQPRKLPQRGCPDTEQMLVKHASEKNVRE